jgi:hypothetical protein
MSTSSHYTTQAQSDQAFRQIALEQNAQKKLVLIQDWQNNIRSLPQTKVHNQDTMLVNCGNGIYGPTPAVQLSGFSGSYQGNGGCCGVAIW